MADESHVRLVKSGSGAIADWRKQPSAPRLDLSGADFSGADLRGANLGRANLSEADLSMANLSRANLYEANLSAANLRAANLNLAHLIGTNLSRANLYEANLSEANLGGADLIEADLRGANLRAADLQGTNLSRANLYEANLSRANLYEANLSEANLGRAGLIGADLRGANLRAADLQGTNLSKANLYEANLSFANLEGSTSFATTYAKIDLSTTLGLQTVMHLGPCSIGTDTLSLSRGAIPDIFLRGCGLANWEITLAKVHAPGLTRDEVTLLLYRATEQRAGAAIQISPVFISYSSGDAAFVDALEVKLNVKGIRFWRDIHDLKAGRLDKQIGRGIELNPTVLLVLSEHSVRSDWVEWEATKARELEKDLRRDVLCPIALDDAWKTADWSGPLRHQIAKYHILPFAEWRTDAVLEAQFTKLVDGLALFYLPSAEERRAPS